MINKISLGSRPCCATATLSITQAKGTLHNILAVGAIVAATWVRSYGAGVYSYASMLNDSMRRGFRIA